MNDTLRFPIDSYTIKEAVAKTSGGEKKITYRAYEHIPYVAKPVDLEYQSMDVWVPETIDGVPVDTANAPILFVIGVGGYLSCSNTRKGMLFGPPPGGPDGLGMPDMPSMGGSSGPEPLLPGLGGSEGPGENKNLAMANGFVVVAPGCRGRDNQRPDGTYYGKAPAAIVDLKAAVRYLRAMGDVIPGNKERILSTGGSAGGALSCLLAASGNHPMFEPYLEEIGAARERDDIFAAAAYSPIINLEHADAAYEWQYSTVPCGGAATGPIKVKPGMVDQALAAELVDKFKAYQTELGLTGRGDFGTVTGDNLEEYLLKYYLWPEATRYLLALPEDTRQTYLKSHSWIRFDGTSAEFTFADYIGYTGRMKGLPAFDDFGKEMAEPDLFGTETQKSRHFTQFSLEHDPNERLTALDEGLKQVINMMNPMYFAMGKNPGCAAHWWIRYGAAEKDTSIPIFADFATALENAGKDVNARLVWDGGHCEDDDPEGLMAWMKALAGN